MALELRPCPYCGGEASIFAGGVGVAVMCKKCYAQTTSMSDPCLSSFSERPVINTVIERWNAKPRPAVPYEYAQRWYCDKCNDEVSPGDKYCHECGSELNWENFPNEN